MMDLPLSRDHIDEQFIKVFEETAQDMLKELHEKALTLESTSEPYEIIDSLFRICHTLKGNAVFFGFLELKAVSHGLEEMLGAGRRRELAVDRQFIDVVWEGIGLLGKRLDVMKTGKAVDDLPGEEEKFISRIKEKVVRFDGIQKASEIPLRVTDTERYVYNDTDISRIVYIVRAFLGKASFAGTADEKNRKFILTLTMMRNIFLKHKDQEKAALVTQMQADFDTLLPDTGEPDETLLKVLDDNFEKILVGIPKVEIETPNAPLRSTREIPERKQPSFRVEDAEIDELLSSAQKLDDVRQQFLDARSDLFREQLPDELRTRIQDITNRLAFLSNKIFQAVVKLKLVSPQLFLEKCRRLIVALAKSCGKKVRMQITCPNIYVERKNIELLESVFIHILRNSIDHGIESPEERRRAGKTEEGLIVIELLEDGQRLLIRCSDDGRGIDCERLKEAACTSGHITQAQKETMPKADALRLIFMPGLTTRKTATEISGRGIGMDMVSHAVAAAGGSISIDSDVGRQTVVEISLPITFRFT